MAKLEVPRADSWYCIKIAVKYLAIGFIALSIAVFIWMYATNSWDNLPVIPFDFWGATFVYWTYSFVIFIVENLIICWVLVFVGIHVCRRKFFSNQFSKEYPYFIVGFIVIAFKTFQLSIPTIVGLLGLEQSGFISSIAPFITATPGETYISLAYYYIVMYFVWDYLWENLFEYRLLKDNNDNPFADLFED